MNLSLSADAIMLVRERGLKKPCVQVSLDYKPPVCTSSFCRKRPYVSVNIVGEDSLNGNFVRVVSDSTIPVYMARPLFDLANREDRPVKIETRGIWKSKRLVLERLDSYKI